jgi:hypothetical protein
MRKEERGIGQRHEAGKQISEIQTQKLNAVSEAFQGQTPCNGKVHKEEPPRLESEQVRHLRSKTRKAPYSSN